MKKKVAALCLSVWVLLLAAACGEEEPPQAEAPRTSYETVELTVWGAEEDEALLQEIFASFQARYAGEADFRITYQPQSESHCKDAMLGDLEGGADVFAFADDQVAALAAAGGLDPIENAADIRAANLSTAVDAASVGGELYAYPLTADNGYFLYYNKAYFSEEDVQSLERMLAAAERAGGLVVMDWTSAWYVYAFFGNTGLQVGLNEDGLTNYCTWNSTEGSIQGVDVARSMLNIAASPAFASRTDTEFLAGIRDGSVIAGVSGTWNAVAVEEAWGRNAGGRHGWRSGSPARRTSVCASSCGARAPPTPAPPTPRRSRRPRLSPPCWPSRSSPSSRGWGASSGIRWRNSPAAWPRAIPPAPPSRPSWTGWWRA